MPAQSKSALKHAKDPCSELRRQLKACKSELREARAQQAAVGDILRALTSTPSALQGTLEGIATHAMRLCRSRDARIWLVDGDRIKYVTGDGDIPPPIEGESLPLGDQSVVGLAVVDRKSVHIDDAAAPDAGQFPFLLEFQRGIGFRTMLVVPLLGEQGALGTIVLRKTVVQPFTSAQIRLVETFAAQASIAIEKLRLFSDLKDRNAELSQSLERQTATAEVLKVISASPTDTQPALDAILASAARLCEAQTGILFRYIDGEYRALATRIPDPKFAKLFERPRRPGPGSKSGLGRITRDLCVVHIPDMSTDAATLEGDALRLQTIETMRTWLGAPLLKDGNLIGAIVLYRTEQRAFSEQQIALLQTFADQAVIAIENVRMFTETREALERQTATAEILRVISSSPTDVQPVFDAIVRSAVRLCGADHCVAARYDGAKLHALAFHGYSAQAMEMISAMFPMQPDMTTLLGRAALRRVVDIVPDMLADPDYSHDYARAGGWRSGFAVPMLRNGELIGTIAVSRRAVGGFSEHQVELLNTFAAQAAIAIENVRLFNETKEALERQTATAEILRVISSSPTDVQPVFDAIVRSAVRLCGADHCIAARYDGEQLHPLAFHGFSPSAMEMMAAMYPMRPNMTNLLGRAALRRAVDIVPDMLADPDYSRALAQAGGWRSGFAVPMLREGRLIGAIAVTRRTVGGFTEHQVELLKTFQAQAAIAIENVRLFNETKEALEQQTVISEILRVISSSPTDTQPVFDAIVKAGVPLFGGMEITLRLIKGDHSELVASTKPIYLLGGPNPTPVGEESHPGARAILRREVVQVPDLTRVEEWIHPNFRKRAELRGFRAIMAAPLLREGEAIGAITVTRATPGLFSAKQIGLLQTFASQAVIAIENVRLFNEIQDKSRQLEVANRHKSQFLANMSHELRTPLNCINGFSEMLLANMFGELNAKQAEFLRDINSSGEHLLALINDVLDLSKIEAGRMELYLTRFDPGITLDSTVMLIKERAGRRGIGVNLNVDAGLDSWVGDERKIRQVVLNLLSNAIKFTPDGGRIDVRASRGDAEMVIAVSDTGIGIKPEDQERIFQEFQQAGSDYTKKAEGTGLGLALSRRFVELHGGTLSVQSAEGQGSTFTFRLPQKEETTP